MCAVLSPALLVRSIGMSRLALLLVLVGWPGSGVAQPEPAQSPPQQGAPQQAGPQQTAPQSAAPQQTAPQSAAPQQAPSQPGAPAEPAPASGAPGQQPTEPPEPPEPPAPAPPAAAQTAPETGPPEPPPLPFGRGTSLGGLVFGLASGAGQTEFSFGAGYGCFVVNGIPPGLSTVVTASTAYPTTVELAPFIRIVPWRAYPISPMLLVKGGRLFVDGQDDLWLVGGGGGLILFASHHLGFLLEALYLRYFPDSLCNPCDRTLISGGV